MNNRIIGAALLLGVAFVWSLEKKPDNPMPEPTPVLALDLDGLFVGANAADDAKCLSCLCGQLADIIEYDGTLDEPRLKTGTAIDDLRRTAREYRLEGASIGSRQPKVRDAIDEYMTEKLGLGGGPITESQRAAWVQTLREISEASRHAVGR